MTSYGNVCVPLCARDINRHIQYPSCLDPSPTLPSSHWSPCCSQLPCKEVFFTLGWITACFAQNPAWLPGPSEGRPKASGPDLVWWSPPPQRSALTELDSQAHYILVPALGLDVPAPSIPKAPKHPPASLCSNVTFSIQPCNLPSTSFPALHTGAAFPDSFYFLVFFCFVFFHNTITSLHTR